MIKIEKDKTSCHFFYFNKRVWKLYNKICEIFFKKLNFSQKTLLNIFYLKCKKGDFSKLNVIIS